MSFQLVPLNQGTAPIISLQRPVVLIGRHIDCDARIDHSKISRRHCCVAIAYDRIILRDLGSRNGLRVNGRVIDEVRLEVGDEVAIGPILFRFEGEAALPSGPAAVGSASKPAPAVGSSPRAPGLRSGPNAAGWALDDADLDLIPLDDI
jgi:pSer/pThr/pTyr-binding forkhead associated (FHA) protein